MSGLLRTLDRRARSRLSQALRVGAPLDLDLDGAIPTPLVAADVAPLFRSVRAKDPSIESSLGRWRAPEGSEAPGPEVTAIIPASRGRPLGVAALRGQDLLIRVLVLSNGPRGPSTVEGATVQRVPWKGHGGTRRAALADVRTPYVLFTVDDAIVLGPGCVRRMVDTLEATDADAVVARQVPWPDTDIVTRTRLRAWTPAADGPVPMSQSDHVCTLYRTRVLRTFPIPDVPIAEDLAWSSGRTVVLAPDAPVLHSHRRAVRALWSRERAIHAQRRRLGLPPTVAGLGPTLPSVLTAARYGAREVPRHAAEVLGQWWGGRG